MLVELTESDRPHRLGSRTTSPLMQTSETLTFAAEDQDTIMSRDWQLRPKGWLRLLGPLAGPSAAVWSAGSGPGSSTSSDSGAGARPARPDTAVLTPRTAGSPPNTGPERKRDMGRTRGRPSRSHSSGAVLSPGRRLLDDIAAAQFEQPAACRAPHRHRAGQARQLPVISRPAPSCGHTAKSTRAGYAAPRPQAAG
jgi:hypothetical protein